jgi:hypothetical protein
MKKLLLKVSVKGLVPEIKLKYFDKMDRFGHIYKKCSRLKKFKDSPLISYCYYNVPVVKGVKTDCGNNVFSQFLCGTQQISACFSG